MSCSMRSLELPRSLGSRRCTGISIWTRSEALHGTLVLSVIYQRLSLGRTRPKRSDCPHRPVTYASKMLSFVLRLSVRKVLVVTATTSVGMALLACSGPPTVDSATPSPAMYERSERIARAPLSPPVGYASPLRDTTPLAPYGHSANEGANPQTAARGEWRASPRWADVKGQGCIVVEQQAVENCSKEDLDAGHERAQDSSAHGPGASANAHEPEWPSGVDEPSPSLRSTPSTPTPPTEHQSKGMIEPWTGAI